MLIKSNHLSDAEKQSNPSNYLSTSKHMMNPLKEQQSQPLPITKIATHKTNLSVHGTKIKIKGLPPINDILSNTISHSKLPTHKSRDNSNDDENNVYSRSIVRHEFTLPDTTSMRLLEDSTMNPDGGDQFNMIKSSTHRIKIRP